LKIVVVNNSSSLQACVYITGRAVPALILIAFHRLSASVHIGASANLD